MPLLQAQKPWIIQKYGGTSLGKLLPTITGEIIPQYLENNRVAVVCSAISGTSKSLGTTSLLLESIEYALEPKGHGVEKLNSAIGCIKDAHLAIASELRGGNDDEGRSEIFEELEKGIISDCEGVRGFLVAARVC